MVGYVGHCAGDFARGSCRRLSICVGLATETLRAASLRGPSPIFSAKMRIGKLELSALLTSYLILIAVATAGLVWLDGMGPRWRYEADLEQHIAGCHQDRDAAICLDLALKYRNGVTGVCSTFVGGGRSRVGTPALESCVLLDRDQDKADAFAQLACAGGNIEGCFYAMNWGWTLGPDGVTARHISDVEELCDAGAFSACAFLNTVNQVPLADPILPRFDFVHQACAKGNGAACLHSLRHRLISAFDGEGAFADLEGLLQIRKDMVDLSHGGSLSQYELTKLQDLDRVVHAYFDEFRKQPLERDRKVLRQRFSDLSRRLEALEFPFPSVQGSSIQN